MNEEIKVITRKWGNSIAVVIPQKIVETQNIKENVEITITLEKKRPTAAALWGLGKGKFKKSTQEIKDEMRRGWLSATDREQEAQWRAEKK